jgi:hypothetical protein
MTKSNAPHTYRRADREPPTRRRPTGTCSSMSVRAAPARCAAGLARPYMRAGSEVAVHESQQGIAELTWIA